MKRLRGEERKMGAKREDINDGDVRRKYEQEGGTQREIADYYGACSTTIWNRLHLGKNKERSKEWRESDVGKKYEKEYSQSRERQAVVKKYKQSDKGKEAEKRWRQTEGGRETMRETYRRWRASDKGKKGIKEYRQSERGRESARRHKATRRELCFIPLNEPFEGSEGHHIDKKHIIYMPKKPHRSVNHNVFTGENMQEINAIAFEYVTEEMVDKLSIGGV